MNFQELVEADLNDVFLKEFAETVTWTSKSTQISKQISIQVFEDEFDKLNLPKFMGWCAYSDAPTLTKNDTILLKGELYGVSIPSPDEFNSGVTFQLIKVV